MMKASHLAIGITTSLALSPVLHQPSLWVAAGAILGSLAPDFDLRLRLPHRGITHWFLWPGLILLAGWHYPLLVGIGLGWLLHLLADLLTVEGLRLWPFRYRFRGPVRTGGLSEYLVVIPYLVLLVLKTWV